MSDGFKYHHPDDPATRAGEDQIRARARDRSLNARSFLLISTDTRDDDEIHVDVSGVIEPDVTFEDEEHTDNEALMRCTCELLIRMWFEGIENEAHPLVMITLMVAQLRSNVDGAIAKVLHEKGML